jgi:hypothetical protein
MEDRKNKTSGMCYKQSYAEHHIAKCGTFQELLEFLEKNERLNGPIISFSRGYPIEHPYSMLINKIRAVKHGSFINWITRAEGLRAKVAELVLANNYDTDMPAILEITNIEDV